jgi:hypothetical protein
MTVEHPIETDDAPASDGERTVAFLLSLRAQGVRDLTVLRAMERVSRERFAPSRFADLARQDVSVPLPCGQTMTAPHTVASLLTALEMQPSARVLEVGTGSGYVSTLLAAMGGEVVSLERYRTLALAAHERVAGTGFEASVDRGLHGRSEPGLLSRLRQNRKKVKAESEAKRFRNLNGTLMIPIELRCSRVLCPCVFKPD